MGLDAGEQKKPKYKFGMRLTFRQYTLTEIRWFSLAQISVKIRPVRLFQARAQSKIGQFYVAPGV